eukprot:scaffold3841_cov412-Prasinococcus_capsulatus_cf.AAC.14
MRSQDQRNPDRIRSPPGRKGCPPAIEAAVCRSVLSVPHHQARVGRALRLRHNCRLRARHRLRCPLHMGHPALEGSPRASASASCSCSGGGQPASRTQRAPPARHERGSERRSEPCGRPGPAAASHA